MTISILDVPVHSSLLPEIQTTPRALIEQAEAGLPDMGGCHWEIYEQRGTERMQEIQSTIADDRERRIFTLAAWRKGWNLSPEHVASVRAACDDLEADLHEADEGEYYEP